MLPRINGYEICRFLRQEGSPLPVVFMTAKARKATSSRTRPRCRRLRAQTLRVRELLARVEAVLRRASPREAGQVGTDEEEFRFGDFVLDRRSRSLRRIGGTEVELSPKEYGLLDYFCRRAGRPSAATRSWTQSGATIPA